MRETSSNTREIVTCERLRQLKMSGMADAYEKQLNDPNADLTCFEERFAEIVEREWQIRYDKKFNRLLKLARLRYPSADIDETINDPARKLDAASILKLSECHWIDEGKNLIITGMTSSGKTYLSNALCLSLIHI